MYLYDSSRELSWKYSIQIRVPRKKKEGSAGKETLTKDMTKSGKVGEAVSLLPSYPVENIWSL